MMNKSESGVKCLLVVVYLLINTFAFSQDNSVLRLKQIDSLLDAGGNPNIGIRSNDSTVLKPQIDTVSILPKLDSLPKKRKGKLAIALGGAFNINRNNLHYSYQMSEDKTDNAFLDFKITPQINFMYISKNNFIAAIEAWEQSGNNVMDNLATGNSLTVTHVSVSLMHLIKAKTTDKFTIGPYVGLKFNYSTKELSYLINYNTLDSGTTPPTRIQRRYSYNETSTLQMVQVPIGITFMSKKIIVDIGTSINLYGNETGHWDSKNNEINTYYKSGDYSKTLMINDNLKTQYILDAIVFKIGYLFQSKPRKPRPIPDAGPADK